MATITSAAKARALRPIADQTLRHDGLVLGQVVVQIAADGRRPVDVAPPRATSLGRAVDRAGHRRPGLLRHPALDLAHDRLDDGARRGAGGLRHDPVESDQGADQVDVGLDRGQQLRFEEHRRQLEPIDRVPLHDLDDAGREVGPDVTEPAGDLGRRGAQSGRPGARPDPGCSGRDVVERGQGLVHVGLRLVQRGLERLCGRLPQGQSPAAAPSILGRVGGLMGLVGLVSHRRPSLPSRGWCRRSPERVPPSRDRTTRLLGGPPGSLTARGDDPDARRSAAARER